MGYWRQYSSYGKKIIIMKTKDLVTISLTALGTYLVLKYAINLKNPIDENNTKDLPRPTNVFSPNEKLNTLIVKYS